MSAHSKLSPSASERWLKCTLAPTREATVPDKSSVNAAEGTAAHALAEHCLLKEINPIDAPQHKDWNEFDSPEFRAYVADYVEFVRSQIVEPHDLFVEQRLTIFKEFDVFGTADAVVVRDGVLHVIDLKFGTGVLVDALDNSQLKLYGYGALESMEWVSSIPIHTVKVSIVQPRRECQSTDTFSADELREWAKEITPTVRKAANGQGEANPGSHCKWCRVRATCKERAGGSLAIAGMDFAPDSTPMSIDGVSEDDLVAILLKLPLLESYIKTVETHVAELAHEREVKGLKWVQGRATRTIINPIAATNALRASGVEPLAEPKLLGVTELEKRCKANKLKLDDVLGDAMVKKHGAPVLVGVDDKREAYQPTAQAVEDFA